jgi:hypothetical protein
MRDPYNERDFFKCKLHILKQDRVFNKEGNKLTTSLEGTVTLYKPVKVLSEGCTREESTATAYLASARFPPRHLLSKYWYISL